MVRALTITNGWLSGDIRRTKLKLGQHLRMHIQTLIMNYRYERWLSDPWLMLMQFDCQYPRMSASGISHQFPNRG